MRLTHWTVIPLTLSLSLAVACGDKESNDDDDTGGVTDDTGGGGEDIVDEDGDGVPADYDCDDADPSAYPGNAEVCDGVDNDCNGAIDDNATDGATYYADADGDGFGGSDFSTVSCDAVSGYVDNSDDCDDLQASVYPGAEETCDGVDQDCDGTADNDAVDPSDFYPDSDGDGYGDLNGTAESACDAPSGTVDNNADCDDTNADINPDTVWYADIDGDGYGAASFTTTGCTQPTDYTADATDCDDLDATVNPGADEWCDGIDNNCDTAVDEDTAVDASTWYTDSDSDGFGDDSTASISCYPASGEVGVGDDCDDTVGTTYPGAPEICDDGIDQDCSGRADNSCQEEVALSEAVAAVYGASTYDNFGRRVAVGDFDGDGVDDLLSGSSGADYSASGSYGSSRGAAYVFHGPLSGIDADADEADATIAGESGSDYLGTNVATLGDQDGDGAEELLIAAYGEDSGGSSAGAVYAVYGGVTGGMDAGSADAIMQGTGSFAYCGYYYMDGQGDINGDGTADVVMGCHGESSYTGGVYTFFGPVTGTMSVTSADVAVRGAGTGAYVGYGGVATHDFDGDGYEDLGVGFPGSVTYSAGSAAVWYGPLTSGTSATGESSADWVGTGVDSGDFYGSRMAGGDFDNDGYNDLVVGAKYDSTSASGGGAVFVYYGTASGISQTLGYKLAGNSFSDYLGHNYDSMLSADVDGDGNDDLVVGYSADDDYGNGSSAGSVHVVYGPMLGYAETDATDRYIGGSTSSEYMGCGVAVTDADGDGQDDLWVGAYGNDDNGTTSGAAWLILGTSLD